MGARQVFWGVGAFRPEFLGYSVWERRRAEDGHSLPPLPGEAQPLLLPAPHSATARPGLGPSLIFFHSDPIVTTPVADNLSPLRTALASVSSKGDIIVVPARCVQTSSHSARCGEGCPSLLGLRPHSPGPLSRRVEKQALPEPLGSGGRVTVWAS